jgi:hypothetical protein
MRKTMKRISELYDASAWFRLAFLAIANVIAHGGAWLFSLVMGETPAWCAVTVVWIFVVAFASTYFVIPPRTA